MSGLIGRLFGGASAGPPPYPHFTLDLPDGWVSGRGPMEYVEALTDHARAYPDDDDRAFELMGSAAGAEGALFMAGAVRGRRAGLTVFADAMQPGGVLSIDDELDAWAEGNMDVLAAGEGVVGDPIVSIVERPYAGRELRWSQSFGEMPPTSYISYCYATAGFVWTLAFDPLGPLDPRNGPDPELDDAFLAIAQSFRVSKSGIEPGEPRR